ncbi:hypothetical protein HMPREF1991_01810 [Hoylesella loescheii DSM 19665 = JCM 12249 = ATCC 15930]|uniref:Uncharacterized protein n=1 Tax=Hoylesella loescheii DSM 19665 = JCM 12249 = ATCC 15930 TaxID=1122985 RepID=A0A069QQK5_HOYLO|nr:hypothetical protein HMPREF1991_01810 [Hoylesella loescheii DSM 19665 = JCM 12249 = ATCC 15930]
MTRHTATYSKYCQPFLLVLQQLQTSRIRRKDLKTMTKRKAKISRTIQARNGRTKRKGMYR